MHACSRPISATPRVQHRSPSEASQEAHATVCHRVVAEEEPVVGCLVPVGVPVPAGVEDLVGEVLGGDPGHGPPGGLVDGRVAGEQPGVGALVPPPLGGGAAEGHQTSHQQDQGKLHAFSPASRTLLDATDAGNRAIGWSALRGRVSPDRSGRSES